MLDTILMILTIIFSLVVLANSIITIANTHAKPKPNSKPFSETSLEDAASNSLLSGQITQPLERNADAAIAASKPEYTTEIEDNDDTPQRIEKLQSFKQTEERGAKVNITENLLRFINESSKGSSIYRESIADKIAEMSQREHVTAPPTMSKNKADSLVLFHQSFRAKFDNLPLTIKSRMEIEECIKSLRKLADKNIQELGGVFLSNTFSVFFTIIKESNKPIIRVNDLMTVHAKAQIAKCTAYSSISNLFSPEISDTSDSVASEDPQEIEPVPLLSRYH